MADPILLVSNIGHYRASQSNGGLTGECMPAVSKETYAMTATYVIAAVAEAVDAEMACIEEADPTEPLNLTSIQNMTIVARLNEDIGDIPVTLLFDCPSLAHLIDYLVTERSADIVSVVGPVSRAV